MRLGLNWVDVGDAAALDDRLDLVDDLGLGTVAAPADLGERTLADCRAHGEAVRDRGLTVGEFGYWENLLVREEDTREARIEALRGLLRHADAMRVDTVVSLVGSFGAWAGSPHPDNYGAAARERARANCERVLDGLDLEHTTYSLEPWFNSFFHTPVETAYRSGELIGEAFDLLGGDVVSVHAKDLALDPEAGIYRLDEVLPGEGLLDYDRYLREIDALDEDLPVFTEHWDDADDYVETMRRLADTAARNGIAPVVRG